MLNSAFFLTMIGCFLVGVLTNNNLLVGMPLIWACLSCFSKSLARIINHEFIIGILTFVAITLIIHSLIEVFFSVSVWFFSLGAAYAIFILGMAFNYMVIPALKSAEKQKEEISEIF